MLSNFLSKYWVIILAVVLHLLVIRFPFVNLEWSFSNAAFYFTTNDTKYLDQYFSYQANTLGLPLLSAVFNKIFPFIDIKYFPRMFSAASYILLGLALIRFHKLLNTKGSSKIFMIVVFLNPLIWIFGGRGTADFFPAAVGIFALALYWTSTKNAFVNFIALIVLSIAITLKYHAVFLMVPIVLEIILRTGSSLYQSFVRVVRVSSIILFLPVFYVIIVKVNLGFWLTPPFYMERHSLNVLGFVNNFWVYVGYLALLLFPFSIIETLQTLYNYWTRHQFVKIAAFLTGAISFFVAGYIWIRPIGEMNFGPMDGILGEELVGGFFMLMAFTLPLIFYRAFNESNKKISENRYLLCLFLFIIVFICILSFTRPTQRYLMFLLPIMYYFLAPKLIQEIKFYTFGIAIYSILNLFLLSNQYATGVATQLTVEYLENHGITQKTFAGDIEAHAGDVFFPYRKVNKLYTVIAGTHPQAVFTGSSNGFLMSPKAYSVVYIQPLKKR